LSKLEQDTANIEIPDPALDEVSIRRRLATQMAQRDYDEDVSQVGPKSLQSRAQKTAVSPTDTTATLNQLMIELLAQEPLHPLPFTSPLPILGPLIVTVRRAWNWMAAKWYVLPLVQQQARLNQQLILLLNELVQRQELSQRRIAELEERLAKRLAEKDK